MGKRKKKEATPGELLVCSNPKARQRFEIEERIETGMVLVGSEVKSLRARSADLEGAYASFEAGELWLHKMHIAPYDRASVFGHKPKRSRKLLAKAKELRRLHGKLSTRGYTLIPLRVYFRDGWAKVELGLAFGKKAPDRRHDLRKRAELREARVGSRGAKR